MLGVQIPLLKNGLDLVLLSLVNHHKHALLGFAQQNLERLHVLLTKGHTVEVNVHAHLPSCTHLGGGAGDARGTHVLHAHDRGGLGQFQGGFEEQLFLERIAHLHRRQVFGAFLRDVLGRERRALDAVLAGRRPHNVHWVARARSCGGNDLVGLQNAHRHRVHEGVHLVALVEEHFAAHDGHPEAVAVVANALDHPFQQPLGAWVAQVAKAQAVQLGDGTRTHGEDVAVDAADPRRRALVRLDGRGVVVALNLECATQPIADVDDAGILFASLHEHVGTFFGEGLQPLDRVLVRAVLAPHHRVHAHLREIGRAAEDGFDLVELFRAQAHLLGLVEGCRCNGCLHGSV